MHKHEIITNEGNLPVRFVTYNRTTEIIPSHWHHHVEILRIDHGSMDIVSGKTSCRLESGDLFVVNSESIHMTRISEDTSVILLQIPYQYLELSGCDMNHLWFKEHIAKSDYGHSEIFLSMTEALLRMESLYNSREPGYIFLFTSELNKLLYQLYIDFSSIASTNEQISSNKHRLHLQKAIVYINSNYKEAISLKEIASHLALNPEYFCRIFKKNMGFTFLHYLNQVRLNHIYEDLINTEDTITSIRERHGFTNYKVFNRMFKETYGCNPSEVRH